jgi:peptide-methionine (S)-S-oxide reductase
MTPSNKRTAVNGFASSLQEKLRSPFVRKCNRNSHNENEQDEEQDDMQSSFDHLPVPQHLVFDEPPMSSRVALGAGRFWGTEKFVSKDFQERYPGSIKSATVGFMSPYDGFSSQPTYDEVCSGESGHVEVLLVELHDPRTHFEELVRFFFQFHDPTTKFQQGSDRGFQYSSWVFCEDDEQLEVAKRVRHELQQLVITGLVRYEKGRIVTCISSLREFTPASTEHQAYLTKHGEAPCYQRLHFAEWPELDESSSTSLVLPSISVVSTSSSSSLSSSSSSALSSVEEEKEDHVKRQRALENLRSSRKRQELIQSIVSTFNS